MKLITRDTDYALRALCFIAKSKDRVVSVSELVKKLCMPRPFLRSLLQLLSKEGILNSYKGIGGGFELVVEPKKLYISRVMSIFQGKFSLNECFLKQLACPHRRSCILKKRLNKIEEYVYKELSSVNIASLIKAGD